MLFVPCFPLRLILVLQFWLWVDWCLSVCKATGKVILQLSHHTHTPHTHKHTHTHTHKHTHTHAYTHTHSFFERISSGCVVSEEKHHEQSGFNALRQASLPHPHTNFNTPPLCRAYTLLLPVLAAVTLVASVENSQKWVREECNRSAKLYNTCSYTMPTRFLSSIIHEVIILRPEGIAGRSNGYYWVY